MNNFSTIIWHMKSEKHIKYEHGKECEEWKLKIHPVCVDFSKISDEKPALDMHCLSSLSGGSCLAGTNPAEGNPVQNDKV